MPLEESSAVFEPIPNSSEKERYPSYDGSPQTETVPPTQAQVSLTMDGPTVFHLTSICCVIMSFFVSPLIEIVPIVMWCLMKDQIMAQTEREHGQLHKIDNISLIIGFVLSIIVYLSVTILSLGLLFFTLILPVFYVVVFVQLRKSPPLASPLYENVV